MAKILKIAYTFDDLLLVPNKSKVLPSDVSLQTKLSNEVQLNIPIISAGMDTVTEGKMAKKMALLGGLGIIHKNLTITQQVKEILKVKSTLIDFKNYPHAAIDATGKLICGAAVGITTDMMERAKKLVAAGTDVLTLDTAHGHSQNVMKSVKNLKKLFPNITLIVGNVATAKAVNDLAQLGADVIKVGVGGGSICTTRIVAGVGVPQMNAIIDCATAAKKHGIKIIADGGIKHSGDIVKALAGGANAVMLGSALAGTDETPGKIITINGVQVKEYRGMGSLGAMHAGSNDRYFQQESKKFVAEGVEATIKYKGNLTNVLFQLVGGIKAGMGYMGAQNITSLFENANFVIQTAAGYNEAHPSVKYIKMVSNYQGK